MRLDDQTFDLLRTMNRGQYLLFTEAVRQLGGELMVDLGFLARALETPAPRLEVDASDGAPGSPGVRPGWRERAEAWLRFLSEPLTVFLLVLAILVGGWLGLAYGR